MDVSLLHTAGLKVTAARKAVLLSLSQSPSPCTAENIYASTSCQENGVNLSTVYRTLHILCVKGIAHKEVLMNGIAYYSLSSSAHQHCLICSICHKVVPIDGCPVNTLGDELSRKTGFVIQSHNLEFYGICPRCAGKEEIYKKE